MQTGPTQLLGVLTLAATLLFAGVSRGQGLSAECRSNPYLPRAKDQYERLEFDPAARTLQRAVEHARNCRRDLAEIYRLKGFIDAINAEKERCQRAFEILLALDPAYVLPRDVPPKIRNCFDDALEVPDDRRVLELDHAAPAMVKPNAPVAVSVNVRDPLRLVDRVQVWFRRSGVEVYTVVSARADDTVSVVIPALALSPSADGYALEYFVRAVDRWEGTLAETGEPRRPLSFQVEAGRVGGDIASEWWFWTVIGAVVVGAAASALVIAENDGGDIPLRIIDGGNQP